MIIINESNKEKCCGCTACANICPKNAIAMQEDLEGFLYPKVDKEKCINCNLCEKVCPIKNELEKKEIKKAYAVQHKNNDILKKKHLRGGFCSYSRVCIESRKRDYCWSKF